VSLLQVDTSGIGEEEIARFAAVDLNGRQIKNVVKMAGLLAADEGRNGGGGGGVLRGEHVERLMGIATEGGEEGGVIGGPRLSW